MAAGKLSGILHQSKFVWRNIRTLCFVYKRHCKGPAKVPDTSADLPQATTDTDTTGQESPELQSNLDLGAEQVPQGLGSRTVNCNLGNRRPLVILLQVFMPLLALEMPLLKTTLSVPILLRVTNVLQEGMGYGIYFVVLPFLAWLIVLVVSLTWILC